jgi:hypothetical protein
MFFLPASALYQARNAHKEWKRRASDDKVGPTSTAFFVFHCLWSLAAVIHFSVLFVKYVYLFESIAQFMGKRAVENAAPWKSPKAGLSHCTWKSRNRSGISTFSTAPAMTV